MEIRFSHQGRVLHEIEITPDAQVHVRMFQQGQNPPPAAQYVWGSQSNMAPPPAAQYVWGSQAAIAPSGGEGHPPANYVWGAVNDHAGGHQRVVAIDRGDTTARACAPGGRQVTEGLLPPRTW